MLLTIVDYSQGILVYWCSNNVVSLLQASLWNIPRVRTYCNIDQLVKHDLYDLYDPKNLPIPKTYKHDLTKGKTKIEKQVASRIARMSPRQMMSLWPSLGFSLEKMVPAGYSIEFGSGPR